MTSIKSTNEAPLFSTASKQATTQTLVSAFASLVKGIGILNPIPTLDSPKRPERNNQNGGTETTPILLSRPLHHGCSQRWFLLFDFQPQEFTSTAQTTATTPRPQQRWRSVLLRFSSFLFAAAGIFFFPSCTFLAALAFLAPCHDDPILSVLKRIRNHCRRKKCLLCTQ